MIDSLILIRSFIYIDFIFIVIVIIIRINTYFLGIRGYGCTITIVLISSLI